jgi:hypothetical protein
LEDGLRILSRELIFEIFDDPAAEDIPQILILKQENEGP